jgi:hypothetical protein
MANDTSYSYALIDGVRISELDLLKYEVRRARAASALLYEKLSARRITELLGDEVASMKRIKDEWVRGASGAWTGSITEIQVTGGSASGFLRWFQGRMAADDHVVMLDAIRIILPSSKKPMEEYQSWKRPAGGKLPACFMHALRKMHEMPPMFLSRACRLG